MKRKLCVLVLGLALFAMPLSRVVGQSPSGQPSKLDSEIAKIKAAIGKRVTDDKTSVKLQLRDGSQVKGRLNQAGDDGFTFTKEKSGQPTNLSYADVQKVNGRGGLGTGAKIGIIAAIVTGVAAIFVIKAALDFDPFKNGIRLQGVKF
jgi:hypothetical protein